MLARGISDLFLLIIFSSVVVFVRAVIFPYNPDEIFEGLPKRIIWESVWYAITCAPALFVGIRVYKSPMMFFWLSWATVIIFFATSLVVNYSSGLGYRIVYAIFEDGIITPIGAFYKLFTLRTFLALAATVMFVHSLRKDK